MPSAYGMRCKMYFCDNIFVKESNVMLIGEVTHSFWNSKWIILLHFNFLIISMIANFCVIFLRSRCFFRNLLITFCMAFMFQLPRLYNVYKEMGIVTSFQNILDNIFLPLFEVTVDPDSHPQLHVFLKQVCLTTRNLFCLAIWFSYPSACL